MSDYQRDSNYSRDNNKRDRDTRDNRDYQDNRDRDYKQHDFRGERYGRYNHNINFNPHRKINYDDNNEKLEITRQYRDNRKFVRGRGSGRGPPKMLSGSMVPKAETPMPTQVKLAMKVITTLGNYSEMTEQDNVVTNIKALANIFLSVGDLTDYAEEISDLFIKCFTTLSIQVPINASLLSLIYLKDPNFAKLVIQKIQKRLLQSLQEDDVPTSKLLLKTLACLCSCKSFALDSYADGSLIPILNVLLQVVIKNTSTQLHEDAQTALFLVTSTIPWCAGVMANSEAGRDFLSKLQPICRQVIATHQSPYGVGGMQAIFHAVSVIFDDSVKPLNPAAATNATGIRGAYDTLYEAVFTCEKIIATALTYNTFTPPECMISPWLQLTEELSPLEFSDPLHFDSTFILFLKEVPSKGCIGSRMRHCLTVGNNTSLSIGSAAASTFLHARIPIYDNETSNEAAACSSLSDVEKYVANHYFQDILYFFDPIVLEDGTKQGSVELLSVHLLAIFKLFPKEVHLEYLLLEYLFGVLLQQPANGIVNSNIYKLILILCKKTAANSEVSSSLTYYSTVFPPALALIVNILYQMIPDMLIGGVVDFSNWFAFHLINTQLSWPYWEFWNDELRESVTDTSNTSALRIFATHFVLKLSKAVPFDKLAEVLPYAFADLLPHPDCSIPKCALFPAVEEGSEAIVEEGSTPTPVVACKKLIEDKVSPEDFVEWFENDVMAKDESATTQWCSVLLIQAILSIGSVNNTLAGITGLLDRYSMVIRSLAHTEVEQQAILDSLVEAYGLDSAMFAFMFDEMLRRSQISTTAATSWATGKILQLNQNTTLYTLFETIVDRSVDFVKASVAQRSTLGGSMLLNDELDLTPAPEPEGVTMVTEKVAEVAAEEPEVPKEADKSEELNVTRDGDDEVDYEEDGERDGKRRRTEESGDAMEGDVSAVQETLEEPESTQDPVWLSTEAVKLSIGNIRNVYGSLLTTLSNGSATALQQPDAPGNALWAIVAHSLLLKTLRTIHGAERNLSHTYKQPVLLSDVPHKIAVYLERSPVLKEMWNERFRM